MESEYLRSQITRANRNRLLRATAVLLFVLWFFYEQRAFVEGYFVEPPQFTRDNSGQLKDVRKYNGTFANVTGSKIVDTGFVYHRVKKNRRGGETEKRLESQFFLLALGPNVLVINAKGPTESTALSGRLEAITPTLHGDLVEPLIKNNPDFEGGILPLQLVITGERYDGWFWAVLGAAVVLFALFRMKVALNFMKHPEEYPVYKKLTPVQRQMLKELEPIGASLSAPAKFGKVSLGKTWLYSAGVFEFHLFAVADLMWAYKKVTVKKLYGIIPLMKRHSVVIWDRHSANAELSVSEKLATGLIEALAARPQKIALGYSEELKKLWGKDRAVLIAQLDAATAAMTK